MNDFPHHLVVKNDFGRFKRGDKITDSDECHAVIASDNAKDVHRVLKFEEPVSTYSGHTDDE